MQETLITTACMGEKYVRSVQEGGKLLLWLSYYLLRSKKRNMLENEYRVWERLE